MRGRGGLPGMLARGERGPHESRLTLKPVAGFGAQGPPPGRGRDGCGPRPRQRERGGPAGLAPRALCLRRARTSRRRSGLWGPRPPSRPRHARPCPARPAPPAPRGRTHLAGAGRAGGRWGRRGDAGAAGGELGEAGGRRAGGGAARAAGPRQIVARPSVRQAGGRRRGWPGHLPAPAARPRPRDLACARGGGAETPPGAEGGGAPGIDVLWSPPGRAGPRGWLEQPGLGVRKCGWSGLQHLVSSCFTHLPLPESPRCPLV